MAMKEKIAMTLSGALMLVVSIALWGISIYAFIQGMNSKDGLIIGSVIAAWVILSTMLAGFFVIEPGDSRVLVLFGSYIGTVRSPGFHWANPFAIKRPVSLRARTLNGQRLKVNDLAGNPIEIATVVVWMVENTYDACFQVDQYEAYVEMQSETALRHSASIFPYDADDATISLRRNTVEVAKHLQEELNERLELAGVKVIEARLSHLAYSAEIAGAMLRRQQADAVIAARQKIVDGAVGMVEMALTRIEHDNVVKLDEERKAQMVANLMTVLCSEHGAVPVINAGSLYN